MSGGGVRRGGGGRRRGKSPEANEKLPPGQLSDEEFERLRVLASDALFELLEEREAETQGGEQRVGGYKVNVEYQTVDEAEQTTRKNVIAKVITKAMQRLRGDDW